ncbi:MAG: 50S ribosomal protein L6 [Gammaproteobacteria bacterium]
MSTRVSGKPINVPNGVKITIESEILSVTGQRGTLKQSLPIDVEVKFEENVLNFAPRSRAKQSLAIAGTIRALTQNMITGVTAGFKKELTLIGVGYRAQAQGNKINLSLGFSHPVVFDIPEGIKVETPTQTQIIIEGMNKQLVGQVAANIRRIRSPEPYKGKGVRYSDEQVKQKETKKK